MDAQALLSEMKGSPTSSALVERFRCPLALLGFGDSGDFSNLALQASAAGCAQAFTNERFVAGEDCDPTAAIDNLRLERYFARKNQDRLIRSTYYSLRPILPVSIRNLIHRAVFQKRRNEFPKWPLDCSVENILECWMAKTLETSGLSEIPFIWFWPEGNNAALMMTHDVEAELGAAQCCELMDLDASFKVPAAFQIIPEGRYGRVEQLIDEIRARGCEVNLHDLDHDGRLYHNVQLFKERAERINRYLERYHIQGFRSGSMHRNQEWFHLLQIEYDMSVPNVACLEPQSGGCCTVMPYFVGNVLELPLTTVQDHALFYVLKTLSIDIWKLQIDTICTHHGLISFIIHPDYIAGQRERQIYCELLQHISSFRSARPIWVALPGEINKWWRQRSQMQLVKTPAGWRIEGEGSERARIAYAQVVDGKLIYRIPKPPIRSEEGPTERQLCREN